MKTANRFLLLACVMGVATACDTDSDTGSSTGTDGTTTDGTTTDGTTTDGTTTDGTTTDGTTTDATTGTTTATTTDGTTTEATTGGVSTPCDGMDPVSGAEFTLDFGAAGTFTYDGGMPVCQMAGIHTGTWTASDDTAFSFSASNPMPTMPTAEGTQLTVTEVRWVRTATGPNEQADRFTTSEGTITVMKGGPFMITNPNDPVTLCFHDIGEMNNVNTMESATFPGPFAVACN